MIKLCSYVGLFLSISISELADHFLVHGPAILNDIKLNMKNFSGKKKNKGTN